MAPKTSDILTDEAVSYSGAQQAGSAWYLIPLAVACAAGVFALLPFSEVFTPEPQKNMTVRQVDTTEARLEPPKLKNPASIKPPTTDMSRPKTTVQKKPRLEEPPETQKRRKPTLKTSYEAPKQKVQRQVTLDFTVSDPAAPAVQQSNPAASSGSESSDGTELAAPPRTGPYGLGEVDRQPTATVRTKPTYPYNARTRGIEGEVQVRFLVTAEGEVQDVRILRASPQGVFGRTVRNTVAGWRFDPARKGGEAVPVIVTTTIRFQLD